MVGFVQRPAVRKIPSTLPAGVLAVALLVVVAAVPAAATVVAAGPAASSVVDDQSTGPEFASSHVVEQQGDVVAIQVRVQDGTTATVDIFGRGPDYEVTLELRDDDFDGRVTALFNTYRAGTSDAFEAASSGDEVGVYGQTPVEGAVPVGSYRLATRDREETAELEIEPRSTDGVSVLVAPDGSAEDLDSAAAVERYEEAGNLTARPPGGTGAVAEHDTLVVQFEASGLSGALAEQPGADDGERLAALLESDLLESEVLEVDPASDLTRAHVPLDQPAVHPVALPGEDRYLLVVDTDAVEYRRGEDGPTETGLTPGDEFEATLTVPSWSDLPTSGEESVAGRFAVVARTAHLSSHEEAGERFLRPAPAQAVEGWTTVAPGSELEVVVTGEQFRATRTVTVGTGDEWGTFDARFDLSSVPEGETVELAARDHRTWLSDPVSATVRSPEARLGSPSLDVEGRTLHLVVTANLSRGGLVTVRASDRDGRVVGVAAVPPGEQEVRVPLSDLPPQDTPLVVTAVRDLDGDGDLSAGDVPYEEADSDRPLTETIALYTLPPSPSPSPSVTGVPGDGTPSEDGPGTEESPDGPDSTGGDDDPLPVRTPGVGVVGALLALAAVLVVAARFGRRRP